MTVAGTPKFNAIAVAKLDANFMGPTLSLKATAAFVDEKTGNTHGWTEGVGEVWSDKTMKKLNELRQSMEEDFAAKHLHGAVRGTTPEPGKGLNMEGGLSEHLKGDSTPSI